MTHQRWFGDTFGWLSWNPEEDQWHLYDLHKDFGQAHDVAAANPEKLAELKKKFSEDAEANHVNPIGASFDRMIQMGLSVSKDKTTDWHFAGDFGRLGEPAAPNIKSRDNLVTVDVDVPANANGVLFSLGDVGAGLTLYVMDGVLHYEYNDYALTRTKIARSQREITAGA